MKSTGKILGLLTFLVFVVAIVWLFIAGGNILLGYLNYLPPQKLMIVAIYSAIALSCSLIIARAIKKMGEAGRPVQPEKAVTYSRFAELWHENSNDPTEIRYGLKELKKHMVIWAGKDVLRDFQSLLNSIDSGSNDRELILEQVSEVMLSIRQDIGEENQDIFKEEIVNSLKGFD